MNNDTILNDKCTVFYENVRNNNIFLSNNPSPGDLHHLFSSYTPVEREIFNKTVYYANKYKIVYPRQTTIARQVGCSREHVNRTIAKFERDGLLEKKKIGYGACVYRFAPFVFMAQFRIILSPLLSAFLGIFLLSSSRIEAEKFKARALFLEDITITYKSKSLKQEGYTLSSRIRPTDFEFWKDKDDGGDEEDTILDDSRCSSERLCIVCRHEQEVKKDIELFLHEVPLNSGELCMDDDMNEAKHISLTEYFPNEPYQTLEEEIAWLFQRARDEAKVVACNKYCREHLATCTVARNNYYRLAWDDLQKERLSTDGYTRRTWQQWAMATWQKPYICEQKHKYKPESKESDVTIG